MTRKAIKIRKLVWELHDGNYPYWTTEDHAIDFKAVIDTGRALMYGKFPLFINDYPSDEKPNTLAQAKRIAQNTFDEWAREAIEAVSA